MNENEQQEIPRIERSLAETPAREGDVRIKSDGVTRIVFSPEDEEKIKAMSKKEAIKYRKELIAKGKFTKKWIPPEDYEMNKETKEHQ